MRKIIFALLSFVCFGPAFATGGTCCHTTVFDAVENMTKNCGSLDDTHAPQNVYIQDGKVAFTGFPYVRKCDRGSLGNYKLGASETRLCAGFSTTESSGTNRSRFDPVADQTGQCWKWQCKRDYPVMGAGGKCMTNEENCASLGLVFRNNTCEAPWCGGWASGYDGNDHYRVKVGNCYEYRCRSGSYFMTSSDRRCGWCFWLQGWRNSCYANIGKDDIPLANSGGDWIVKQCTNDEYVDFKNGKWGCAKVLSADDARIKSCWKCRKTDNNELLYNCIKNGVVCK